MAKNKNKTTNTTDQEGLEIVTYTGNGYSTLIRFIKKLSKGQQKGEPVPYYIGLLNSDTEELTIYGSYQFRDEIQTGKVTKLNNQEPLVIFTYQTEGDRQRVNEYLTKMSNTLYHKVKIDRFNINGWANTYYAKNPNGQTKDFIGSGANKGEIREPLVLADYIVPYEEPTNLEFSEILDTLNPVTHKKDLGTFYTPVEYAKLAKQLVYQAIRKHQESGNRDYIILDRCAGTGHLELFLNDEVPHDIHDKDILSHVILNTYSQTEYFILQERFGDRVLYINPPDSDEGQLNHSGTDALSYTFLANPVIQTYLDDPNITIILYENPPYGAPTNVEHQKLGKSKSSAAWRQSYLVSEMKRDSHIDKSLTLDLINVFVWSAFNYYITKPSDSYIVIAPIKYYKVGNLANKVFQGGYGCNRKHFSTKIASFLMMASWGYEEDLTTQEITMPAYDIDTKTRDLLYQGDITVKKVSTTLQVYYDTRVCEGDVPTKDIQGYNGRPPNKSVKIAKAIVTNPNILANLIISGFDFNNPDLDSGLVRVSHYAKKGFYIRRDNYLEKLPLFAASRYVRYNNDWKERGLVYKSGDGYSSVQQDLHTSQYQEFLKGCLLFTCLEIQNHIFSFYTEDGTYYRNELCLDDTHGDTVATQELKKYTFNQQEQELLLLWSEVLTLAKESSLYDSRLTYGLYHIQEELCETKTEPLYQTISKLKLKVKGYYNTYLLPLLFTYQYLK